VNFLQSIVWQTTKHDQQVSVLTISHLYIEITIKLDVCWRAWRFPVRV